MSERDTSLRDAFLDDHRTLVRGLSEIQAALEAQDVATASRLADELDQAIGAHIEFEEREFYPALRARFGSGFVDQLYGEHAAGRQALETLCALSDGGVLEEAERATVLEQLRSATQHALSCGSLTSHMDALPPDRQRAMLASLERIRARGTRWTRRGAARSR